MKHLHKSSGRPLPVFLPALLMGALGVAVALIDPSFGVDEAYTMDFIKGSYREVIALCAADVHPPLYFFLLKAWVDFWGLFLPLEPTALAKLFSALPLVLLLLVGATAVRRWWGDRTAWVFGLCCLAGNLTHYASVLRMYSWAALFVTLAGLAACRILGAGRPQGAPGLTLGAWALLALSTLGAAYTHYFACVSVGWVYLFLLAALLLRHQGRRVAALLACGLTALAGYLPWLSSLMGQLTAVKGDYWIEPMGPKTLLLCLGAPFATEKSPAALASGLVFALLFGGVLFAVLAALLKERLAGWPWEQEDSFALLFLLAAPATVAAGALAGWLLRPVFVARYMVPCVPSLWLGLALACRRLTEGWQKRLTVLLCLVALASCGKMLHTEITQGMEYRRFMAFHDQVIGDELLFDDEYHLRETLFFIRPHWNHQALEEDDTWDGESRVWVIAQEEAPARALARTAPAQGSLQDEGAFQFCEEHFHIYRLSPGGDD